MPSLPSPASRLQPSRDRAGGHGMAPPVAAAAAQSLPDVAVMLNASRLVGSSSLKDQCSEPPALQPINLPRWLRREQETQSFVARLARAGKSRKSAGILEK